MMTQEYRCNGLSRWHYTLKRALKTMLSGLRVRRCKLALWAPRQVLQSELCSTAFCQHVVQIDGKLHTSVTSVTLAAPITQRSYPVYIAHSRLIDKITHQHQNHGPGGYSGKTFQAKITSRRNPHPRTSTGEIKSGTERNRLSSISTLG